MIGDSKIDQQETSIGCKCNRNHERTNHRSSEQVFQYRGYKGMVRLFHKDDILPVANITHFALGNAIVGLNLSDTFYIVSKHTINRERLLLVSNTTDA